MRGREGAGEAETAREDNNAAHTRTAGGDVSASKTVLIKHRRHAAMGSSCTHLCLYAGSHANTVCHLRCIPMFSLCENLAHTAPYAFALIPRDFRTLNGHNGGGGEGERGGGKEGACE